MKNKTFKRLLCTALASLLLLTSLSACSPAPSSERAQSEAYNHTTVLAAEFSAQPLAASDGISLSVSLGCLAKFLEQGEFSVAAEGFSISFGEQSAQHRLIHSVADMDAFRKAYSYERTDGGEIADATPSILAHFVLEHPILTDWGKITLLPLTQGEAEGRIILSFRASTPEKGKFYESEASLCLWYATDGARLALSSVSPQAAREKLS